MPSVNYRNQTELKEDCKDLNITIEEHLNSLSKAGFDIYVKGKQILECLQ